MKKVKPMLMSLLVVAVVGGALAFKAKSPGWFCSTDSTQGACTVSQNIIKLRFADPGDDPIPNKYCTDQINSQAPCLTVTTE